MREARGLSLQVPPRKRDSGDEIPREECGAYAPGRTKRLPSDFGYRAELRGGSKRIKPRFGLEGDGIPAPSLRATGRKKASGFFNKMLEKGLWIKNGAAVKGFSLLPGDHM